MHRLDRRTRYSHKYGCYWFNGKYWLYWSNRRTRYSRYSDDDWCNR
jgi:hypothetical protein